MVSARSPEYLAGLVNELRALRHEVEWVEFKRNFVDNQGIGEYISALSNSAALLDRPAAYLVWGIEDGTHAVKGTNFAPATAKQGNEPLENWLLRRLNPQIDFQFHECEVDGQDIVILEISPASYSPVAFGNERFIRVGSAKKKLKEHPENERMLWRILDRLNFEDEVAAERVISEDVLDKLNFPAYFELLNLPLPEGRPPS